MEDREIVNLYWQRNEKAISETSLKYQKYCYRIASNILSRAEDIEESLNDTWMHAWNSMPPHKPERLSTFLGKITRYICLKKWRESRAQKRGGGEIELVFEELSESIPETTTPEEILSAKEIADSLNRFLAALSGPEREVFLCRYYYLDPIQQISDRFGFSQSKVKTMLYRTRKKLKSYFEKEGVLHED